MFPTYFLLLAESGTGKTSFIKLFLGALLPGKCMIKRVLFNRSLDKPIPQCFFFADKPIYVHTREPSDFDGQDVTFLPPDFMVDETFFTALPDGAFVFLDDYKPTTNKQEKLAFLSVINYYLRHHKITLFLVVHNLHGNGLFTDILLAPHIFLAYSTLGYYVLR